jgi:predicted glycosyltransferase
MLIGDSQTMTSEAAVLGTPAVRCNTFVRRISYLEEEEFKYNLTYGFLPSDSEAMFQKLQELLSMPDLKQEWKRRRAIMLADKIDVTAFFVWFIENYPASAKTMRENPDYQYHFK